jgi:uncharacterized RDD family membrane protein YckC
MTNGSHRPCDASQTIEGRTPPSGLAGVDPSLATDARMMPSPPDAGTSSEGNSGLTADSWRVEIAARLERYRSRRKPRTPRYPSLLLPFDAPGWPRPTATGSAAAATAPALIPPALIPDDQPSRAATEAMKPQLVEASRLPAQNSELAAEPSAKVIEFPRSAAIPAFLPSELADPVVDLSRPRIVEAPEILPPPPALGGMLIEPARKEPVERRPGVDFPCASASLAQRAQAMLVDAAILAAALAAFTAIFLRMNPGLAPGPSFPLNLTLISIRGLLPLLGPLAIVAVLVWMAYQFVFVVYTGATPGLRAARLQLARFDGSALDWRTRRWRVLASFLSAFSAGLGYFWCLLDQDGLCWHDRITRTNLHPGPKQAAKE